MAAAKKKQDEINLKVLRELTSHDQNKKCLECGQRGITYADMTTSGFVCVQCSGYLRGINPPHRVKSISMTSFSEKEIGLLKEGGNEVARNIWMGNWNPAKDREPDKKQEMAFKQFLMSKYERKQWYKSPAEVKAATAATVQTKVEQKLKPPPSTAKTQQQNAGITRPHPASATVSVAPPIIQACTAPTMPATTPSTAVATPNFPSKDLLSDLGGDPFASKKPVGAVSVMVGGVVAPLIPSNTNGSVKTEEFGAFTGASGPLSSSSSSSLSLQPTAASLTGSSAGDKYAELASLDTTFRGLRVKDPSPLLARAMPPQAQTSTQPFGGSGFAEAPGSTNPFSSPATQVGGGQSNPFVAAASGGQPQQQGSQFGGGFPQQQQGGFPQQQQQGGFPQQQQFPQQPGQQGGFPPQQQMQGGFPQQQPPQGQGFPQQQGGFPQQQGRGFPQQQMQGGFPQQGQQGGFPQQQVQQQQRFAQPNQFVPSQQWGSQQPQAQAFGGGQQPGAQVQWGGGTQQPAGGGGGAVPQQQWGAQVSPQQGAQFGGGQQQQQGAGFVGAGGFGGMQQQQGQQGQQFGGQQQQPQQQQSQQQQKFDWSVCVSKQQPQQQPQQPTRKYINWGGGITRIDNSVPSHPKPPNQSSNQSESTSTTSISSTNSGFGSSVGSGGWSTDLTKPVSDSYQQPSQQQSGGGLAMGWSSVMSGADGGHSNSTQQQQQQQAGFGQGGWPTGGGGGGGGFGQQDSNFGGVNPFASTPQSGSGNPFL